MASLDGSIKPFVPQTKLRRLPNFTQLELDRLVDASMKRISILKSSSHTADTNKRKEHAWREIAAEVSSVCEGYSRNAIEARKKMTDLRSEIRKRYEAMRAQRTKTGAASPDVGDFSDRDWKLVTFEILYEPDPNAAPEDGGVEVDFSNDADGALAGELTRNGSSSQEAAASESDEHPIGVSTHVNNFTPSNSFHCKPVPPHQCPNLQIPPLQQFGASPQANKRRRNLEGIAQCTIENARNSHLCSFCRFHVCIHCGVDIEGAESLEERKVAALERVSEQLTTMSQTQTEMLQTLRLLAHSQSQLLLAHCNLVHAALRSQPEVLRAALSNGTDSNPHANPFAFDSQPPL